MIEADIQIRGAREHNLRNVSLTLPRNQLIVLTGVSGSGKSSLAFDTLYAEGQRRYVESLSSYARQFLGQMPKPEVDSITGLAPSISIQQKTSGNNPRSTVGTITEIYDYLRILYARVGEGRCPTCARPITAQSREQILTSVLQLPAGTRFLVLAPLIQRQKGEYVDLFQDLLKQGYLRARVDGRVVSLSDDLKLDRQMRHSIELVVDRLQAGEQSRTRLIEAIETALRLGKGSLIISQESSIPAEPDASDRPAKSRKTSAATTPANKSSTTAIETPSADDMPATAAASNDRLYSAHYACNFCQESYEPPSPQLFSFNSPQGYCRVCEGLGEVYDFDLEMLIPDQSLSVYAGAIALLGATKSLGRWRRHLYEGNAAAIASIARWETAEAVLKSPWNKLPPAVQQAWLIGLGSHPVVYTWKSRGSVFKHTDKFNGVLAELRDAYRRSNSNLYRSVYEKYMRTAGCHACAGTRLNPQARSVFLASTHPDMRRRRPGATFSLPEVCKFSIAEVEQFFTGIELQGTAALIAGEVLKEIRGRLGFLLKCGLDYLTLDRPAPTLSGGESQRIRLAGQIGCGLVGVVYILDEPSIGLHPRDNDKLLESLLDLRNLGNTVIVVEHDEETIRAADHLVDFGPGPGVLGGEVVAEGPLSALTGSDRSLTGAYLSGARRIAVSTKRRMPTERKIELTGIEHNNLRNFDVAFPLGLFVCVTGVSGSGKSSLVNDVLWKALHRDLNRGDGEPGPFKKISGLEHLDKAIDIDQSPIGRTPRSNPATYIKLFDLIRDLYTQLPESKLRGYKPGRFSFNVTGGRCEACEGNGSNRLEMDFLADVWVTCPVCQGKRFGHETLQVLYKGKSISDVLDMDVSAGLKHFENLPKLKALLETLKSVGLEYLKLGQPSPTLSGGEAQRIKLSRELGKRSTGRTVYLLDEPTTGLHFADVHKLLELLHNLVEAGNTVIVVEHHLDVIKTADWVIDLGPEGGSGGGKIVVAGTPEDVAGCAASYTGRALAKLLAAESQREIVVPDKSRKSSAKSTRKSSPKVTVAARSIAPSAGAAASRAVISRPIVIRGAEQHNLQHVDVEIPRHSLSVFCGPSGSGKTSLAMDTLYAEGQRRYVESLSSYARQFLGQMPKPKVEHVSGLSPAIAIEQKTVGHTPRSTVGTVTEIYDYFRILYARLGQSYCPQCNIPVSTQTTDEVTARVLKHPAGTRALLVAPQTVEVGADYATLWERLAAVGYRRVRIDGATYSFDDLPELDRRSRHDVEVVVDRITISGTQRGRIAESISKALDLGRGWMRLILVDESRPETDWTSEPYSLQKACLQCGSSYEELTPHHFSFNAAVGWCPGCDGLGVQQGTNLSALVGDARQTLRDAAIAVWPDPRKSRLFARMLDAIGEQLRLPLDIPYDRLNPRQQRQILFGTGDTLFSIRGDQSGPGFQFQYKGLYPAVEEAGRVSPYYRTQLEHLTGEVPCTLCQGSRLRADASAVRFHDRVLQELTESPLGELLPWLRSVKFTAAEKKVAGDLLTELTGRLSFLVDVGLDYLTLSRTMPTLSGGESQRIRLAGQIGRALTGVLYVLDEPTIGLHPRDNARLMQALQALRNLGNTVVVVEHDQEVLEAADLLYDFGPGAGRLGGRVTASGKPREIQRNKESLTGAFLSGREQIITPRSRRMPNRFAEKEPVLTGTLTAELRREIIPPAGHWLELRGARLHNLRNVDLCIPLGTLTAATGVSGSGKSSLIEETFARALAKRFHNARDLPGPYERLVGTEFVDKIIRVDQQPLGHTPASNPATYTGVFDLIRDLFARLPDAKMRGYGPGRFSFNRAGGRCETCEGNGQRCIEMHFLPDVWVQCDDCAGRRFNSETCMVRYRGQSIADVLAMSIGQAADLFENIPKIRGILATLSAVGLDYLTLGQSAGTLSGGEAQRVKLAAELARPQTGKTVYVLDEPTTGLHFEDIRKLLRVLHSLVQKGNTVVVIEHNLDVIKTADWVIDLGPEAGRDGGWIVAEGTPEDVVRIAAGATSSTPPTQLHRSYTGELLAKVLERAVRGTVELFDAQAVSRRRNGDLDLRDVGHDAQMPWQVDGPGWHTRDRIAHNAKPCKWEGAALEYVSELLQDVSGLPPINWNNGSVVEVGHENDWLFHALTRDEWFLKLKFRMPRGVFMLETVRSQLGLIPAHELPGVAANDRTERVFMKTVARAGVEFEILVHTREEIETLAFRDFVKTAAKLWLEQRGMADAVGASESAEEYEVAERSVGKKARFKSSAPVTRGRTLFPKWPSREATGNDDSTKEKPSTKSAAKQLAAEQLQALLKKPRKRPRE